jgi:hypothetical protein
MSPSRRQVLHWPRAAAVAKSTPDGYTLMLIGSKAVQFAGIKPE